jgi:TRAP-type C4-dicarboxylate transport system permease small subunit
MKNTTETQMPDADAEDLAGKIDERARRLELQNPDEGMHLADRIINRIVEIAGVSVLSTIVAVIFSNAASRYIFNYSFSWAEELVQMSMPWLAMTGVFLSVRRGTVIRIDFFFEKIPSWLQGPMAYFGYCINIAVLILMAYVSLDFVRIFGGDVALYVQIPTGLSTSALVFGTAGAAMAYMAEFFREWRQRQLSVTTHGPGS